MWSLLADQSNSENYNDVILAVFKYLSMMRFSALPKWYQHEIAEIRRIRFRFQEKRSPDDYATWMSEHMAWPVPRDQILSGTQLVEEWDDKDGERDVRDILAGLRVENGRVLLMAKKDEHERVGGSADWSEEPVYGTPYRVQRFNADFISEVTFTVFINLATVDLNFLQAESPNDIPELYLPGPNEFIPTNLNVDKREVDKVISGLVPTCIGLTVICSLQNARLSYAKHRSPRFGTRRTIVSGYREQT